VDQTPAERFALARVARLATRRADGRPRLVPVTFAARGDVVWTAVDAKPKTTRELGRVRDVRRDPRVSLLVDHYEEDWSALWWVRADGLAEVVSVDSPLGHEGVAALREKYPQYAAAPPPGPVAIVRVERWVSWTAAD
jgi:PPOX class probable F420-dependent enzyme